MIKRNLLRLLAAVMLAGFFQITTSSDNAVHSTLPREIWVIFNCVELSEAVLFTINMGIDNCDITRTGLCSDNLIRDGFLQSVCSGLDDGVTYTCNISRAYTEPVCCVSYTNVNLPSSSCFTNTVTADSPRPTPNRTPSVPNTVPVMIKFQPDEYEVTEGSDAQVCLVITNGTVLITGITIDVCLDPSTDTCREVHFPEGTTVGDHQCITFPNTSLQAGRYTLRADVLTLPFVNTTAASAALTIQKRGSSKWVKGVIGVAVIMIVGGSGGGCAAYIYYLIPKRMSGILDWALRNCSTMIGISNEQHTPGNAEDGNEGPLSRRYSRSVQERVRGGRLPTSATQRGSQDTVGQSDVQHEGPPNFTNLMEQRKEDVNDNIPLPVCVELPESPAVISHGSIQPTSDSSVCDSETVYLQPMHTMPCAVLNTTTILLMKHTQSLPQVFAEEFL